MNPMRMTQHGLDSLDIAPLPTPEEMAEWDRNAIERTGIKEELLMENASREALAVLEACQGPLQGKKAVCFAGSGNNGGDAFALARHLHNKGVRVLILHVKPLSQARGATGYHIRLARHEGIEFAPLGRFQLETLYHHERRPDIVVDGLLGTGFHGDLRPDYQTFIEVINSLGRAGSFILALDIPSGLNGLKGLPQPKAVKAHVTVTFEATKLGLAYPWAAPYVGRLEARAIGIPRSIHQQHPAGAYLMLPGLYRCLPPVEPQSHKGSFGHVLIVGGSEGLTGAAVLAAHGALRSGAGLVTVACPAGLTAEVKSGFPECMTLPVGKTRAWEPNALEPLLERLPRFDALVLGPGLGRDQAAKETVETILHSLKHDSPPLVLDADGLYHLAANPKLSDCIRPRDLLTPHPGEMARLLDSDIGGVQSNRVERVRAFARCIGATTILKGAGSVLAGPEGPVYLSPFSTPCLAIGGAGDVLAGMLGRLVAQDMDSLLAAIVGVYWHGRAGRLLENDFPRRGNLARDIAQALPRALEAWHAESQGHHDG